MSSSAINIIAGLRQCSDAAARSFCESVQKAHAAPPPSFKAIADALSQNPSATAGQVAQYLKTNPQILAKHKKHHPHKVRKDLGSGGTDLVEHVTRSQNSSWTPASKNPLRSRNRLEPSKATTCPHGIPYYRTCAICQADTFHEMTGM